ncbi:MAG: four-carbon acid sugar kinase family protein, partial [Saprospiraceae bacterium]
PARQLPVLSKIQQLRKDRIDTIIVLDDDPTGTQTVYDLPVLTNWDVATLVEEFQLGSPIFYILTNSRSLTKAEATQLATEIGKNIKAAAKQTGTKFWMISRSDSTLRGHYPSEVDALEIGLAQETSTQFFIPAFFEGGRFTINNFHYVQQADKLIPAAQTPYAKDKVFGFQHSNLVDWIQEKSNHNIERSRIQSISLDDLRTQSSADLIAQLNQLTKDTICIVNAASYNDLYHFALAVLQSEVQPIFRTAASFVRAIAGLAEKPLLTGSSIKNSNQNGGLIIVGSYVPTSTLQLQHLLNQRTDLVPIEIKVEELLTNNNHTKSIADYTEAIDLFLKNGKTVVLYTSRDLVAANTNKENLNIGNKISRYLTQIVAHLKTRPAYLLTKGGITSSDIATKSVGVKRALVKGQILKGVPVLALGAETKFPDSYQIIFPGNVGIESSLTEVVDKLTH